MTLDRSQAQRSLQPQKAEEEAEEEEESEEEESEEEEGRAAVRQPRLSSEWEREDA